MKKLLIACALGSLPISSSAQGITFEHGDFEAVCVKAKAEKKLVFIDDRLRDRFICKWY